MALLGKESNYVGIDIGSSGVRLVQLKHGGGKPLLVTYGDSEVPQGLTQSDAALDRQKTAETIRTLAAEAKVSTKYAIAGIPSLKIYASVITVPRMSEVELAKGIRYQAEHYIPMALDQVKLDWSVIENPVPSKEMEVLLVATPNQTAEKYMEICQKAGFELLALEPNALAMSRALVPSGPIAVIVLDMGGVATDLTILSNGVPMLIRSIQVGGVTFLKSVAQHLGVDEPQAEQFIRKFGLTKTKLEGQVYNGLKPALDTLLSEIDKSIKYFMSNHEGVKLERVVMTGGSSQVPELPAYLATATGLPVEIGNPWINVSYPASLQDKLVNLASSYAVAAGLALKEVG